MTDDHDHVGDADSENEGAADRPEWWYRTPAGDVFGPYTTEELRRYAEEGRIESSGRLRRGDDGDWLDPASTPLRDDGAGFAGAPPIRRMPPSTESGDLLPSTSRTTYILLGILPYLLVAVGGIHNLVAGRIGPGVTQLVLSLIGVWGFGCIGLVTNGLGWCASVPIWFTLLIWIIVEISTVTTDGAGRRFTS